MLHDLFINRYDRLRSGWRVAVFVVLYMALLFLIVTLLRLLYAAGQYLNFPISPEPYVEDLVFRFTLLVAALIAGYVCTRFIEGLPWRALGLTFHYRWFRLFVVGSVIGSGSLILAAVLAMAGGGLRFSFTAVGIAVIQALISAGALFVLAALAEEALFRGYALQTLTRAHLAWLGVLLTSVPFAAAHLSNPNVVKGFTFLNTALAGIWLALAYLRTRSLWFPLGVHWAWNWTLDSVLGLPVSGIRISTQPLFKGIDNGPAWLTGGSYGIEGGAACLLTLIISSLVIWRTRWVDATPEMLALTSNENPKSNLESRM